MKELAIFLLFSALPIGQAHACSPPPPRPERDARAESVQVGYVVGERWPDYEASLIAGGKPSLQWDRRLVRVVFTEALKGKLSLPREVSAPCSAPFPEIRERVFVVHHKDGDYLIPADFPDYERELRAAIASGR